jgi:D-threo-aldose 1-dehydrogenase
VSLVPASSLDRLAVALSTEPARLPVAAPRDDAVRQLLQTAADAGVREIASRPEDDVERRLGQAWPFPSPFRVSVRTIPIEEGLDRVEARARRSLEKLGLPRADLLLVRSAADLAGADGRALWDRLQGLKARGLYRRLGFVAGDRAATLALARALQPDVVQAPLSLVRPDAWRTGLIEALAAMEVTVQLTSIFADGALFLGDAAPDLSRTRRRLAEAGLDPMQAALAFALSRPGASSVVAAVSSAAELRAVLAAAHAPTPLLDWERFLAETPAVLTAGAPRLVSSAA